MADSNNPNVSFVEIALSDYLNLRDNNQLNDSALYFVSNNISNSNYNQNLSSPLLIFKGKDLVGNSGTLLRYCEDGVLTDTIKVTCTYDNSGDNPTYYITNLKIHTNRLPNLLVNSNFTLTYVRKNLISTSEDIVYVFKDIRQQTSSEGELCKCDYDSSTDTWIPNLNKNIIKLDTATNKSIFNYSSDTSSILIDINTKLEQNGNELENFKYINDNNYSTTLTLEITINDFIDLNYQINSAVPGVLGQSLFVINHNTDTNSYNTYMYVWQPIDGNGNYGWVNANLISTVNYDLSYVPKMQKFTPLTSIKAYTATGNGQQTVTPLSTALHNETIVKRGWTYSDSPGTFYISEPQKDSHPATMYYVDTKFNSISPNANNNGDYAEFFEWEDENPNHEDRVGLVVSLVGDKIKLASSGDKVLGIITGHPVVYGDAAANYWHDKYLKDNFGRIIDEEYTYTVLIPTDGTPESDMNEDTPTREEIRTGIRNKLNPDYDESREYIPRSKRPEWGLVGIIGKLEVRDDGTCQVNSYATVNENGTVTASNSETNMYVMSRVDENIVCVFLK